MTALTTEQRDLAEAVTDLMAKRSPEAEVRRLMATDAGYDPGVWAELAGMGLLGLAIPEEFGGSGAGAVEVGLVMEAMGRALLCAPYLSTAVLTTQLLAALGDSDEQADVLPRIAAGELITTVAFAEAGSARPPWPRPRRRVPTGRGGGCRAARPTSWTPRAPDGSTCWPGTGCSRWMPTRRASTSACCRRSTRPVSRPESC
ncbi:acyl-CoA dehydrogenase family protein [Mycolicibacterium psychrotolerans]|uniref:acyl-CoA dehydrogenase family protein n=1 Tax=Mycolicibacterium psychrotolerans TaxID=216929 RepID=UPI003D668CB2